MLTPKGRALLARALKLWRKAQAVVEREIGAETSATLRSLLHRVAATQFSLA
jgi:DNA-binding MarR family transcriptional regulator